MGKVACHSCGKELSFEDGALISRSEECPHCAASVRCCVMCRFYDPSAYNNCREPVAERILDSTKANYCDYFKLASGGGEGGTNDNESLLDAANKLFKD